VARPRAEIAAAIDEIASRLVSAGPAAAPVFPAPSAPALAAAGPALAASNATERARGLTAALAVDPASIDLRLSAVEALIAARDYDSAIRLAGATPPAGTPKALARALRFQAGAAQLEAGRYAEAGATFDSLRQAQETAAVLNNLGVARFRLRDPEASALFSRAFSFTDQRQNDISFNRALALLFEGRAEQALPALDRSMEASPRDAQVRLLKVWALRLLNRETERGEEWGRLMAIAPSFASLGTPDLARRLERIFFSERAQGIEPTPQLVRSID
jgi:tetratricopeptide (TPR) repeat protein